MSLVSRTLYAASAPILYENVKICLSRHYKSDKRAEEPTQPPLYLALSQGILHKPVLKWAKNVWIYKDEEKAPGEYSEPEHDFSWYMRTLLRKYRWFRFRMKQKLQELRESGKVESAHEHLSRRFRGRGKSYDRYRSDEGKRDEENKQKTREKSSHVLET